MSPKDNEIAMNALCIWEIVNDDEFGFYDWFAPNGCFDGRQRAIDCGRLLEDVYSIASSMDEISLDGMDGFAFDFDFIPLMLETMKNRNIDPTKFDLTTAVMLAEIAYNAAEEERNQ